MTTGTVDLRERKSLSPALARNSVNACPSVPLEPVIKTTFEDRSNRSLMLNNNFPNIIIGI